MRQSDIVIVIRLLLDPQVASLITEPVPTKVVSSVRKCWVNTFEALGVHDRGNAVHTFSYLLARKLSSCLVSKDAKTC